MPFRVPDAGELIGAGGSTSLAGPDAPGGGGGTGVDAGGGGTIGSGGSGGMASMDGATVTGGAIVTTGGAPVAGGATGTGGARASGGATGTGGARASGGNTATGGTSGGCSDVSPCGGDVVATWTVTSACLTVAGTLDLSAVGIGCRQGSVAGSRGVTGTWTAKADGTYMDRSTTFGSDQIVLPASCLMVSGITLGCDSIATALGALGYQTVRCVSAEGGGCSCTGTFSQDGGIGLVSPDAPTTGTYVASGNVITIDSDARYSYCVSGDAMAWTPRSTTTKTTGTIVFKKDAATGTDGGLAPKP